MSLPAAYFEQVFAGSDDPWSFRTRWYEARKRALTLAALPRQRFLAAFEPGCANGELTAQLAPRCGTLLATDVAPRAVAIAREHLAGVANVTLRCESIPSAWPVAQFDLIVISEMAYYFDAATVQSIASRIRESLTAEGVLLLCHWRHFVEDYPLTGDAVHDIFQRHVNLFRLSTHEEDDFLLDVWGASAASVAVREGLA